MSLENLVVPESKEGLEGKKSHKIMGACQKDTTERAPKGKSKTFKAKNKVVLNHNTKYKIPKSY